MMAINERKSSCEQIFHYHYIYTMKFLSPALYLHNIYPYYYLCRSKNLIVLNSLKIAYNLVLFQYDFDIFIVAIFHTVFKIRPKLPTI